MSKYAPGPYILHDYDFTETLGYHQGFYISSGDRYIADIRNECAFEDREQMLATANLLGAAPEMYEALKEYDQIVRIAITCLRRDAEHGRAIRQEFADKLEQCLGKACEAIAKAEGKQ